MSIDAIHLLTAIVGLIQSIVSFAADRQTVVTTDRVVVLGKDVTAELIAAGWTPPGGDE